MLNSIGIDLAGPCWTVSHLKKGFSAVTPVAHLKIYGEVSEKIEKLKAHMKETGALTASISLALPPTECLVKVLSLPSTDGKALAGMLGFELERHLPSDAGHWRWYHSLAKAGKASSFIMLTAVKAERADVILSTFEAAGISVSLVTSGQTALAEALRRSGFVPPDKFTAVASVRGEGMALEVLKDGVLLYSSEAQVRDARQAMGFALSFVKELPESFVIIDEDSMEGAAEEVSDEARRLCGSVVEFGPVPSLSRAFGAAFMALENRSAGASLLERDNEPQVRKKALAAAGAAMLAVLGIGAVVAVNDMLTLRNVENEIELLGEDRIKAETLMRHVETVTSDIRTLEEIKGGSSPGFLDTLRRLTELTPEDTYLTGLEYGREKIVVDGVSQKASGLFMRLSGSGFAEDINYDGPVVRGQDGKERFRIKFRQSGGGVDGDGRTGS